MSDTTESDLEKLLSTREIEVGKEKLTIREYSLIDSLALYQVIDPFVEALAEVMKASEMPDVELVRAVMADHKERIPELIGRAIDRPAAWVAKLSAADSLILIDWWWVLNRAFFIGAATRKIRASQVNKKK